MALDDDAVIERSDTVDTSVEDRGLEFTVGSTEGVDVGVAAAGLMLGVDVGVADDAVVGGYPGVDKLYVEGTATDGILGSVAALVDSGFTETMAAGDVVDPIEDSPARALKTAPL